MRARIPCLRPLALRLSPNPACASTRSFSTSLRHNAGFGFAATEGQSPRRPSPKERSETEGSPSKERPARSYDREPRGTSRTTGQSSRGDSGNRLPTRVDKNDRSSKSGNTDPRSQSRTHVRKQASRVGTDSRPLNPMPDFSSLPPLEDNKAKIHFIGLHHDTALRAFHRPSTPYTPLVVYRDNLIHLRAAPTRTLPTPPDNPFPPSLVSTSSFRATHSDVPIVQFGVIASKNNVSKLASERGYVRSRFKAAVEGVVHRSVGLRVGTTGSDLLNTEWSYLAMLSREVYEASMSDLCRSVGRGLLSLKRLQEKGIGSDRHREDKARDSETGPRRTSRRPLYPKPNRDNDRDA